MPALCNEGWAGVSLVPGGSADSFRALLVISDNNPPAEREAAGSPAVRVTRKVACAISGKSPGEANFSLTQSGPINVVTRLLLPRKGEHIHAVVSWRSSSSLTLLCFTPAPVDSEPLCQYINFFTVEAKLQVAGYTDEPKATMTTPAQNMTPL